MNEKRKFHWAYLVVLGMCGIQFGTMGTVSSCMGVFTSSVAEDLAVPVTAVALYFSIRTIAMAICQPIAERMFAKLDVRLSIAIAIITANGSMMMLAFCHHIALWYVSAVIAGFGLAFICYLLGPIILNNWFKTGLGTSIGIAAAFTGIGGAVFSPLVGKWIATLGFRPAYLLTGGIGGLVSIICCFIFLRTRPEDMGLKPIGYEKAQKQVVKDNTGMTVGQMVKSGPAFILVFVVIVGMFFIGAWMQDITNMAVSKGFDIQYAALVSTCMMLGIVVGKLLLGFINDRIGPKACSFAGLLFAVVSMLFLLFSGGVNARVYIGAFLFGPAVSMMSVCPALLIRRAFGGRDYSKIVGIGAVVGVLTSTCGHPIYASVYDKTGNYDMVMVAALIAVVVCAVCIFLGVETSHKKWAGKKAEATAEEA